MRAGKSTIPDNVRQRGKRRKRSGPDRWAACLRALRPASGFTMIEVMVVIGILAVAATIVAPNLIGWRGRTSLRAAVNELRGDLLMMKTLAIKENTTVTVTLNRQTANYTISFNGRDLKSVPLPSGISLNPGSQSETAVYSFNSRGGSNNGTIVLAAAGGNSKQIVISTLGRITLRD
jgi:prepilin-type N-terminal cleavage/methylation domain-containing protein